MSIRVRASLGLVVVGLALAGAAVSGPGRADEKADLKEKVNGLVQQLGDPDSEKQAAAAAALLKLGPDVLTLLPAPDAKLSEAQKKHLQAIRDSLREAQALKGMVAKTFTLKADGLSLGSALKELARQTGIEVVDRRRQAESEPRLNLDLNKVTFWEALDDIARKADLRLGLYERDGKVALKDGPHLDLPVSYFGVFRVAVKRLTAVRDLDAESHTWTFTLEIAWEPRFKPLFLDVQADNLVVQDGKGTELKNVPAGGGRAPVARPVAVETQVRVEAPARPADKVGLLKGSFNVVGPSKMLTFTFDRLTKFDRGKPPLKAVQEGVTVNLRELKVEPEIWTLGFLLEYPPEGPEFESFESWLVNNEIHLEKKDGKGTFPANGGYDIDEQGSRRAILSYRFIEDNKLTLGKPEDWKLVYRTPGTIVQVPVKFEFKDLPVP